MFKIGEKVRVKEHLADEVYADDVRELAGKIVTIKEVIDEEEYYIEEDSGEYNWFERELEKIEESDSMFKVGDRVKIGDLDLTVNPYNFMMEEVKNKEGEILEVDLSDNTALVELGEFELYDVWIKLEDLTLVEKKSEFKVGDKVRVLDIDLEDNFYAYEMRETIDEIGTIRKIYDDHVEVYFEDDYWHYKFEDVEVLDFVPKYKVGDKVRILSDDISAFYNEGDIDEIISVDYDDEYLTYELEHTWVEEDDIELAVEDEMKFKIGDRVKIIDDSLAEYYHVGEIATILEFDEYDKTYLVEIESDGDKDWTTESDIELVVEESEFKTGDRVKIVSMNGGETESSIFEVGHIGTITEIGGYHGLDANVVRLDNRMIGWVDTEDLELIETEKELKFKVGDKVRIVGTQSVDFYEIGDVAEIINIDYGITNLPYELEDDWVNGDDLELVEEVESSKFKVGDRVKTVDYNLAPIFKLGDSGIVRKYDDSDNTYYIEFSDETEYWTREDDLELVEEVEEVELKVGDKVKIVGDYFAESYFVGETAEILRVDTNDETYLVYIESRDCNDWVDYTDVELIEKENEFKIGDKVKVISKDNNPTSTSCWDRNHVGTITFVDEFSDNVVQLDDENKGWVHTDDLELIEELKFEIGDKVRLISRKYYPTVSSVYRVGDTGKITKIDSDDNNIVNLDDDACGWVDTDDLVHVDFTFREVQEELGFKFMTLEQIEHELGYKVVIVSK